MLTKLLFVLVIPFATLLAENDSVPLEYGESYSLRFPITQRDKDEIKKHLEYLVNSTLEKSFLNLPERIHPSKGLYVDLKGYMDTPTLKKEISEENSYFSIYFFDTSKLKIQKKSENVRTVRDLLILSGGLILDFHFESKDYAELKLRFKKNREYEAELNNPIFIKDNGKWYIFRLF